MSYDITLDSKQTAFNLVQEGIDIANNEYQVSMLHSDITVVSIMKLPSFISDEDIRSKLVSKGVKIVSPIYRRAIPGTQVADGTRFMRCKFPQGMFALPWTIPFKIGSDTKYFRLVHNNQMKVCSECLSPEHMRKQCPYFVCHGCGEYGHSKRQCKAIKCEYCHNLPLLCVCGSSSHTKRDQPPAHKKKNCEVCENDDEDISDVWSEKDVGDADPIATVPIEVNVVQNKQKSHLQKENRKRQMDSDTESNNEITDDEILNLDNEEGGNENINSDKDFLMAKKVKIASNDAPPGDNIVTGESENEIEFEQCCSDDESTFVGDEEVSMEGANEK
ncbi:unnamed protein product [Mytilus coruscus]|uniref:CCHC-type domain-containing protein n=1 Tax=Mytilus coruscus TaxID=42192 RepID=A0A6J8BEL3_MYTCO|nr:unnamed protein product [Mytilus coruscus]